MGAPSGPPHLCWKWPWDALQNPNPKKNPCGGPLELPWLLKSLNNIHSLALTLLNSTANSVRTNSVDLRRGRVKSGGGAAAAVISPEQQGEAEQRALAAALASGKEATVIEFYSPKCRLCSSLLDTVLALEVRNKDWVNFVLADAENEKWLPELLHYDIKYVPCFVLLDKYGRGLAKTGVPHSRQHVLAGLSHLLKSKRPATHHPGDLP